MNPVLLSSLQNVMSIVTSMHWYVMFACCVIVQWYFCMVNEDTEVTILCLTMSQYLSVDASRHTDMCVHLKRLCCTCSVFVCVCIVCLYTHS